MFNFEKTFQIIDSYEKQSISLSNVKVFFYFFPLLKFLDILSLQLPEINFLQLIPGFYFFFVLVFFSLFILTSFFLEKFLFTKDRNKNFGIKTYSKIFSILKNKKLLFLSILSFFFVTLNFFPLSLDSINSYGEKNLENFWSFSEVLNLEVFFIVSFFILCQIPIFFFRSIQSEQKKKIFPNEWKKAFFSSFVLAGIFTPTVDIKTQVIFAFSTIFLYFLFLYWINIKILIKSTTFLSNF